MGEEQLERDSQLRDDIDVTVPERSKVLSGVRPRMLAVEPERTATSSMGAREQKCVIEYIEYKKHPRRERVCVRAYKVYTINPYLAGHQPIVWPPPAKRL